MQIAIQKGRAIVLALLMAAAMLFSMAALSSTLPKAHSEPFDSQVAGILALDNRYACNQLDSRPGMGAQALYSTVWSRMQTSWQNGSTPPEQVIRAYIATSVIAFCPQHLGRIGMRGYGPGLGSSTVELVSNYRWLACNLMATSGVDAAVNELAIPKIVYPIGVDEARKAVLISALILCPNQLGAVYGYLGI